MATWSRSRIRRFLLRNDPVLGPLLRRSWVGADGMSLLPPGLRMRLSGFLRCLNTRTGKTVVSVQCGDHVVLDRVHDLAEWLGIPLDRHVYRLAGLQGLVMRAAGDPAMIRRDPTWSRPRVSQSIAAAYEHAHPGSGEFVRSRHEHEAMVEARRIDRRRPLRLLAIMEAARLAKIGMRADAAREYLRVRARDSRYGFAGVTVAELDGFIDRPPCSVNDLHFDVRHPRRLTLSDCSS